LQRLLAQAGDLQQLAPLERRRGLRHVAQIIDGGGDKRVFREERSSDLRVASVLHTHVVDELRDPAACARPCKRVEKISLI
jgi:hypothetical protein